MSTIGSRIRFARESLGITQEQLGKNCGTTKQTIFKYENDIVTNIPMDRIEAIAACLRTTPSYLLGWSDKNEKSPDQMELTEGELAFIKLLRRVPAEDRPIVIEKILSALDKQV